jgi:hypothetical protein
MVDRPALILVAALLATFILAACSEDRLSKSEFISRADEICQDINKKSQELGRPSSPEQFDEFAERGEQVVRDGLGRLRELEPPADDEALIARFLKRIEEAADYLPQITNAVQERDVERINDLGLKIQVAANQAQEIASEYGFKECARSDVAPGTG